jgi:hypothetical protein
MNIGTGIALSDRVDLNGAFQYNIFKGTVATTQGTSLAGEYNMKGYTYHLGADFRI